MLVSALAAAMIALSAYLQAHAKWWGGVSMGLGLAIFAVFAAVVQPHPDSMQPYDPVSIASAAALICAALILIGSLVALVLRSRAAARTIAIWTFLVGYCAIFALGIVISAA